MKSDDPQTPVFRVEIQWFDSANDGLGGLRRDRLYNKNAGSFATDVWETGRVVTGHKPAGTVWARIRFIAEGFFPDFGAIRIDNVIVTGEQP